MNGCHVQHVCPDARPTVMVSFTYRYPNRIVTYTVIFMPVVRVSMVTFASRRGHKVQELYGACVYPEKTVCACMIALTRGPNTSADPICGEYAKQLYTASTDEKTHHPRCVARCAPVTGMRLGAHHAPGKHGAGCAGCHVCIEARRKTQSKREEVGGFRHLSGREG